MRLHRLELQAFLAFPGHERIDFDPLNDAGLFLLTGRTGAGKSTILDAICFALYGQVPGERGVKGLRSTHADPGTPTEVELELTLRDRRLRVRRRPEQERARLRGEGTTIAKAEVTLTRIDDDGTETVLSTRLDEAGHELGELLGMTPKQFFQVVMLPQGQFQQFLLASTDDRQRLLADLFDVTRFEDVERWLKGERDAAIRDADAADRAISDLVSRATQVLNPDGDPEGAAPPQGWERRPHGAVDWVDEHAVVAEAQAVTAAEAATSAAAARESAEIAHTAGRVLAEQQELARTAIAALAAHAATRAARDAAAAELDAARAAAPAAALLTAWETRDAQSRTAATAAATALQAARRAGVPVQGDAQGTAHAPAEHLTLLADERRRSAGAAESVLALEERVDREATALAAARSRVTALDGHVTTLRNTRADLQAERPAAQTRLEATQAAAAAAPGAVAAADQAAARAGAAVLRDRLARELVASDAVVLRAREDAVTATEALHALQQRRLDAYAAELAQRLAAGEACAVCGATEHPSPAPAPEEGLVGDAEFEQATADHEAATAARDTAMAAHAELQARHAAARAAAGEEPAAALRETADSAAADAEALTARAVGVDAATAALAALDTRSRAAEDELRTAELELGTVRADLASREAALTGDRATVEAQRAGAPTIAERVAQLTAAAEAADAAAAAAAAATRTAAEAGQALEALRAGATQAGFGTPQLLAAAVRDAAACAELEQRVRAWDAEAVERRAGAARPDLVAAAAQAAPDVEALAAAVRSAKSAEGAAQDVRTRAVTRRGELRNLSERLAEAIDTAGPVLQRRATVVELSDLAAGRSASNRLKISLSAYVLAARLEEVAAAATTRLLTMTDGRYRLQHSDGGARGRSRGGLDLMVHDAWSGDSRPPSSLSGGETFMASLALALGLADTVTARSGGLRLDTLFVDEGFGSLDDEGTLDDVLEALDALREGGRTVGLVSHVAEMRQRIPMQVRVEKRRDGSTIAAATAVA